MNQASPIAVILAAGKGTRMRSDLPKVLHPVGGRPMVHAVVSACMEAGCQRVILVVGYMQDLVRNTFMGTVGAGAPVEFAVQEQQLGTGHAVQCCGDALKGAAAQAGQAVFVLAGDGPLLRAKTLKVLLERHRATGAVSTLATSVIDDPTGYGRIVRDAAGKFTGIVEHKQCTPEQLKIREVNPSYYCFDAQALFATLPALKRNEPSGEYYITDVPALQLARGQRVEVIDAVPPEDILSINTPEQLAEVDAIYRRRLVASVGGRS